MRPEILNPLFTEVEALKGVGPQVAKLLKKLDLTRVVDLLYHLPTGAIERVRAPAASASLLGRNVILDMKPFETRESRSGRGPMRVFAADGDGNTISLIYFNNPGWAKRSLPVGQTRTVSGKLEAYGDEWQIIHPEVSEPGKGPQPAVREPVYPLTEGLTNRRLGELAREALERAPELPEWIEPSLAGRESWSPWRASLAFIHREPGAEDARRRLAYDEVFANQLALLLLRQSQRRHRTAPLAGTGELTAKLRLPYQLTGAQHRVIEEIRGDMAQTAPMLRLLQGDVGSGKTLVALLAMLAAVESGAQAALLAPTEILARQHHATLLRQLDSVGVRVAILTGREKGRARESVLMGLADRSVDILIGTHAIFQEKVAYKKLGLAVIDEQHRFGVLQRAELRRRGVNPDVLVVTATPIPRSLAMTVYGDLEVSIIDEMPPGRTPVSTHVRGEDRREKIYEFVRDQVKKGRQAYVVYPIIEESEKLDLRNATEMYENLRQEVFPEFSVGLLHGKMKPAEKEGVMAAFGANKIQILVATTVIEVGVDVPNATVMLIEHAERFGLSQLHQLRGRVGRGAAESFCILLAQFQKTKEARERLKIMEETTDGFKIAEKDLEIRGPGEVMGTRQSGIPAFRIANIVRDQKILEIARREADYMLNERRKTRETDRLISHVRSQPRYGLANVG
jgi:ATP-dependent DNA helicase RecG